LGVKLNFLNNRVIKLNKWCKYKSHSVIKYNIIRENFSKTVGFCEEKQNIIWNQMTKHFEKSITSNNNKIIMNYIHQNISWIKIYYEIIYKS